MSPYPLPRDLRPRITRDHPRLMATPTTVAEARSRVTADPLGLQWETEVYEQAVALLPQPTIADRLGPGLQAHLQAHPHTRSQRRRLEDDALIGRALLGNIQFLGLAYLWWGEGRFSAKAKAELLAAAAIPSWGMPSEFLDVAETCHAFGIGFDWLYDTFSVAERQTIATALIEKGLKPGLTAIRQRVRWAQDPTGWNLNWIIVCNAGLFLGALGIWEQAPDFCAKVLDVTLPLFAEGFVSFAPDGGWAEGPGYWFYASAYAVYGLAGLQTALGSDFGIADLPGFSVTGDFRLYTMSPTYQLFNYADGETQHSGLPWVFWLASRFGRPTDAWMERAKPHSPYALDLLWFTSAAKDPTAGVKLLDSRLAGVEVATFFGAWNDTKASYIGIKGGSNRVSNHCHLDLGSFVLDTGGQRFAVDLGEDDYALDGYFDRTIRFQYYRCGSSGHNVVLVGGRNQRPEASAHITNFVSTPELAGVVIDLESIYETCALQRVAALIDRRHFLIADEIVPFQLVTFAWQMHTGASVILNGSRATLTQGGVRLYLRILTPAGGVFSTADCNPPAPQKPNTGITNIVVNLSAGAPLELVVAASLDPLWIAQATPEPLKALKRRS